MDMERQEREFIRIAESSIVHCEHVFLLAICGAAEEMLILNAGRQVMTRMVRLLTGREEKQTGKKNRSSATQ